MTNTEFIRQLYEEEATRLKYFIENTVFDKELAEDILQETFYIAMRRAADVKQHPKPAGWLYETAKYIILAECRKKNKRDLNYSYEEMELELEDLQAEWGLDSAEDDAIKKVLSESEYNIIDMIYNQGYSNREAARELGVKESTLRVKLMRIRNKLNHAIL